jgi:hypothetical protein
MKITIDIPDQQWEHFKTLAQNAVATNWNGKYEDFAACIMLVKFDSYITAMQKRKQAMQTKRDLASYEQQGEQQS